MADENGRDEEEEKASIGDPEAGDVKEGDVKEEATTRIPLEEDHAPDEERDAGNRTDNFTAHSFCLPNLTLQFCSSRSRSQWRMKRRRRRPVCRTDGAGVPVS
jgi:hypothetical protein